MVDNQLSKGTQERPQILMRFEIFKEQNKAENPVIIVTVYNGLY